MGVLAQRFISLRKPFQAFAANAAITTEVDAGIATFRSSTINWTPRMSRFIDAQARKGGLKLFEAYTREYGLPDIVHVHSALYAGSSAREIKKKFGIPYVLSEHSSAFGRNVLSRNEIKFARGVAVDAAARFAVSATTARLLENRLDMEEKSWAVMANSVDHSFLESKLDAPCEKVQKLLHVSHLNENKAVDLIIRAFAANFGGHDQVTLTIGGDGPLRQRLIRLTQELGVASQVHFPGKLSRDEVRAELSSCSAFVLSSRYETFGVVLVEALAMGRPVIATRCGGPEDIVTDGDGILFPVDDQVALEKAMEVILNTQSSFPPQALRNRCASRFGPEELSSRWCDIYGDNLSPRHELT